MTQLPLAPQPPGRAQALRIIDDYGPIGRGASAAHSVRAENGQEYLAKGPTLAPAHPYAAANEFIAATLADHLGLPVLDYRILQAGRDFYFGSSLMPQGTFYPAITEDLFNRCVNKDRVYGLVIFDAWICNVDRHEENLLVRNTGRSSGPRNLTLLLNDHSHCLILPGETPADLGHKQAWDFSQPLVRLPFIRSAITETRRLRQALDEVEAVADVTIAGVVASLPTQLLPGQERPHVEQFLRDRRAKLRAIVRAGRAFFSNLDGGQL